MKTGIVKEEDKIIVLNKDIKIEESTYLYEKDTDKKISEYSICGLEENKSYYSKKKYHIKKGYETYKIFDTKEEAQEYLNNLYEKIIDNAAIVDDDDNDSVGICCCQVGVGR